MDGQESPLGCLSFMLSPHDEFFWATSGPRVTLGCISRALLLVITPQAASCSCLRPQTLPQGGVCCSPSPAFCGSLLDL